jgi:hypothetical protein
MTSLATFTMSADMADGTTTIAAEQLIADAIAQYLTAQGLVANVSITCTAVTPESSVASQ